ncbi:MBL fold metallo-hydrolase, partial [Frankia sp. Cpl3]|nr:MBL fold metallo-hydrolase [Frankia sp. Cpl3]
MRLTVLGCQSPYPGPGGATPGYLLQTDSLNLLIDCGSGVISQLTKVLPIFQLDAVLISHYHQDHIADIGVLQYGMMVHQSGGQRDPSAPLLLHAPGLPEEWANRMNYREATQHQAIDGQTLLVIGDVCIS